MMALRRLAASPPLVPEVLQRLQTSLLASTSQACGYGTTMDMPAWDIKWLAKEKAGRKSGMKKYKRHQWYFANPNYDPNQPWPKRIISPYAPPEAYEQDPWQLYRKYHPQKDPETGDFKPQKVGSYRRRFRRFLHHQHQDWQNRFFASWRQHKQRLAVEERLSQAATRQDAFQAWRQDLWDKAMQEPAEQSAVSARGAHQQQPTRPPSAVPNNEAHKTEAGIADGARNAKP